MIAPGQPRLVSSFLTESGFEPVLIVGWDPVLKGVALLDHPQGREEKGAGPEFNPRLLRLLGL